MKKKQTLKYGFNYKQEFKEYKKVCGKKNKKYSYTDWYYGIKTKYDCYDIKKLLNFEKFLNWEIEKLKRWNKFIDACIAIIPYISSVILPIVSIMISIMTYIDNIQVSINQIEKKITGSNDWLLSSVQMDVQQVKNRVEVLSNAANYVNNVMLFCVITIAIFCMIYLIKFCFEDRIKFFEDFRECIIQIRSEKSVTTFFLVLKDE